MRHILEPYYKLFIDGKGVAIGDLDELRFMAKQCPNSYEIYAYYKSLMEAPAVTKLSIAKMKEASEMKSKGISVQVIARRLGIPPKYLSKIFIKNNLATI